ncbi:CD59 glycoprotein-like [Hemicordylus capensis]|uniref:CD59 glycoprotein-like n=1 Tax=Hemicordylus capensis TaxID=884348 RepID=UPI002304CA8C|nr:CD59 glycoprotein-like [Hemicordylus capensis]XP_053113048.1 CD59 glycoprotein-like [Hemicordylus capensis]XP_053113053.1 CD59 glycoprotein-like [Hemicordylus capensis]
MSSGLSELRLAQLRRRQSTLRLEEGDALRTRFRKEAMDKTKYFLLIAFFTIIVFCSSGNALRCYSCEQSPMLCRTNVTCSYEDDVCLQIRFVNLRTYSCWKTSRCNTNEIANYFHADSFRFLCCYRDLCNKMSPRILVSTAALGVSAMTMVWMMYL